MKLTELYEKYMYDVSLQKRRTTIDSYNYRFKRVLEFYDDCEITEITYDSAVAFQHELYENKGFSAKYTNHVVSVLNQVVSFAYAKGYISHFPLAGLKGIKSTKVVEKEYYDLKTFQEFISFVDDETDHLMFDILFFLGLRKGELLALRWKNIDLVNGIVTIDSSMKKIKGKGLVLSEPKTKNSYRKIVCNKLLTKELEVVL
ncbi:MAG: site-specific integrase, partial [Erysipelotrichaceae bacterium]|nr:site-specific integrase [Erysipelotrichaceae bacterium]